MPKTLYISDLDGTLFLPNATLSDYTVATLNRLIENGLLFSVNTARTAATCDQLLENVNFSVPIILMYGALIYDFKKKRCIRKEPIDKSAKNKIIASLKKLNMSAFMYAVEDDLLVTYYDRITSNAMRNFYDERKRIYGKKLTHLDDLANANGDVIYFCCHDTKENIEKLYSEVSKIEGLRVEKYPAIYSIDHSWYIEIISINASKGNALKHLRTAYNIDHIVCFGDSLNDLTMFEASDTRIAVSNANSQVKEKADEIIGSNEEDGVAKWLCENATLSK